MAVLTKAQLEAQFATTLSTKGTNKISGPELRKFLRDVIDTSLDSSRHVDRTSRYVVDSQDAVDVGETPYRSSIRRETGTVGRDGEFVHLDLSEGRRRIVYERPDLAVNPHIDLPASDHYQDICFYGNIMYMLFSTGASGTPVTELRAYAVNDFNHTLTSDLSLTHRITRGLAGIKDVNRVEIVSERTIEGEDVEHLFVAQDNATYATTRVYGIDFTATIEGANGNGWKFLFYGLPGSAEANQIVEPSIKVVNTYVPVGTRREEVVEELNDTLVRDGAPFTVALAPGQDGTQVSTETGGTITSPATAGGRGKSRLFRADRTVVYTGIGIPASLADINAEANPNVVINGVDIGITGLGALGSLSAVAATVQASIRSHGSFLNDEDLQEAVVIHNSGAGNGTFSIGIPGVTTLILSGTIITDMGLLPDYSNTSIVWEIDDAEDSSLTAGYPIVGMHYSAVDKTLYVVLSNGQVHAIDRRWFGKPDTRIRRREFQIPEGGTVYSASTYETDGTMTVASLDPDGQRRMRRFVFNSNIPIGEVRSVAKFLHRSVDVTDADDPGQTAGDQGASKWDTKSIPEIYGVAGSGVDNADTDYGKARSWWDLEDPRKFYFGEPVHNRGDVLVINVDTARGDVDYQVERAAEGPAVALQLPKLIKQALVGETSTSRNHANTLFRLEPKVYVLKTVFVIDVTDFPTADDTDEFDLIQVGTRWTLKRVTPQQDDVVAVQVEGSDYPGQTGSPKTVITDVQDEFEVFDSHALHWLAMELSGGPTSEYKDPGETGRKYRRAAKFQAVVELFEVVD